MYTCVCILHTYTCTCIIHTCRRLQEDEEHWGSAEDAPSSLAQDVCEVRRGEEERESPEVRKWDFTPPHLLSSPGPCSCWRSTRSERHASARSLGSGWLTAAWGAWQNSCRGTESWEQGRRSALGHQDPPGSNGERRDERESREGAQRLSGDAGFAGLSALHGNPIQPCSICHAALLFSSYQLPAARGAIPRESRSPGAASRHLYQQDHLPGQLWPPPEVRGPMVLGGEDQSQ